MLTPRSIVALSTFAALAAVIAGPATAAVADDGSPTTVVHGH